MSIIGVVVRFIVSTLVLMAIGYIVPGFSHLTFGEALLAALVIAAIGYLLESVVGRSNSNYGRGIVGFVVAAAVIYATQLVVPGMHVTIIGAILASFIIGLVDLFIPTVVR